MGIPLNVKKNFKVILKIIILNYYLGIFRKYPTNCLPES